MDSIINLSVLVEKMDKRINDWRNKTLSFAGRVQLIRSVLSSMHTYRASMFVLPTRIIKELEQKMRDFLWNQGSPSKGKAKVAWKAICLPKNEGGLGIRRIADMNKALITKHVWAILNKRDSLWVQWIYDYKLKGRNFWEVKLRAGVSWSWRKILQLRSTIRQHIWTKIGNGLNTSVWFDKWCDRCPLIQYITPRAIKTAGFDLNNNVADLFVNGEWKFPSAWYDLFPILINLPSLQLNDRPDYLCWHDTDGSECEFSSTVVWDSIRYRDNKVPWVKFVWYPQCIPRHSFHLWLVLRKKLKTQDRMKWWDAGSETNVRLMCCSLCQKGPDSRSHLFFECEYSSNVLNSLKPMADLQCMSNKWESIATELSVATKQKTAQHVISKLLVASTTYYIWQERNQRLFTNSRRTCRELGEVIKHTVRLKLLSLRFKNSARVHRILDRWKLPPQLVFDNG